MKVERVEDCPSPREMVKFMLKENHDLRRWKLINALKKYWGLDYDGACVVLHGLQEAKEIYYIIEPMDDDSDNWLYSLVANPNDPEILQDQEKKHDADKPRMAFLLQIPDAQEGLTRVFEHGADKYGAGTWDKVEIDRYINALVRHVFAMGEDAKAKDEESGLLHIDHVLWNAAVISQMIHSWKKNCPLGKALDDNHRGK